MKGKSLVMSKIRNERKRRGGTYNTEAGAKEAEAALAYLSGMATMAEISRALGVSYYTVQQRIAGWAKSAWAQGLLVRATRRVRR